MKKSFLLGLAAINCVSCSSELESKWKVCDGYIVNEATLSIARRPFGPNSERSINSFCDWLRQDELNEAIASLILENLSSDRLREATFMTEFYVSAEKHAERYLLLHLEHEDGFLPENRWVFGNASGYDMTCRYDTADKELLNCSFWQ